MTRTIRLQSDSNAHDRPWRVAVEQGFFAAEGLNVEYFEDNPNGAAGRVEDFSTALEGVAAQGRRARSLSGLRMGRDRAGAGARRRQDHRPRHHRAHRRADGGKGFERSSRSAQLRNVPIAVTWHAGTFYAAIEMLEAAGVAFDDIKLVHANDRLEALLSGTIAGGGADGAAGEPGRSRKAPARSPTCAGAAASSPATISMRRRPASCGARSTAPSPGCAKTTSAPGRRCCAIFRPSSAKAG